MPSKKRKKGGSRTGSKDITVRLRAPVLKEQQQALARVSEYSTRAFAGQIVGYFEGEFKEDIAKLSPKDRIDAMIRLSRYVFPVVNANVNFNASYDSVKDRRSKLMEMAQQFEEVEVFAEEVPVQEEKKEEKEEVVKEAIVEVEEDIYEDDLPF